jgi:ketosteroid isomerase-like protein
LARRPRDLATHRASRKTAHLSILIVDNARRQERMSQTQTTQSLARFAQDWVDAELHGDAAFLDRALAADFVAVGPLGFTLTKDEWIGRHRSGNLQYHSLALDEVTTRQYGDVAILIARQSQDAAFRGNSVKGDFRTTVVLVQRAGSWQIVSVQLSPIGQPPAFVQPQQSPR